MAFMFGDVVADDVVVLLLLLLVEVVEPSKSTSADIAWARTTTLFDLWCFGAANTGRDKQPPLSSVSRTVTREPRMRCGLAAPE